MLAIRAVEDFLAGPAAMAPDQAAVARSLRSLSAASRRRSYNPFELLGLWRGVHPVAANLKRLGGAAARARAEDASHYTTPLLWRGLPRFARGAGNNPPQAGKVPSPPPGYARP